MEQRLRANIAKIYIYGFFLNFMVMIPILVPYWQSLGLNLRDIFLLQGVFGAALIIFDAPAGYVADVIGRKKVLVVGSFISAIAFQFLWFGRTFLDFALMEMTLGLGLSLQSGCDVAILYNSLERLNHTGSRARTLGIRLMVVTLGEGSAALLCGLLSAVSLKFPIYVQAIVAWIPALAALTFFDDGLTLPRGSHLQNMKMIGRALFGYSRMLTLTILSFVFYSFATYCAVWAMQPYWQSRGIEVKWFGYLWAVNNFAVAVVGRYAHVIEKKIGFRNSLYIIAAMPVVGYFGMGVVGGLMGLLFILAFPICRGLNGVLFQDAINSRVPPEIRATTNSIGSLGMRTLFLIFGPVLGATLDAKGPDQAMVVMGWVYVGIFLALTLPLVQAVRRDKLSAIGSS